MIGARHVSVRRIFDFTVDGLDAFMRAEDLHPIEGTYALDRHPNGRVIITVLVASEPVPDFLRERAIVYRCFMAVDTPPRAGEW